MDHQASSKDEDLELHEGAADWIADYARGQPEEDQQFCECVAVLECGLVAARLNGIMEKSGNGAAWGCLRTGSPAASTSRAVNIMRERVQGGTGGADWWLRAEPGVVCEQLRRLRDGAGEAGW
ncbi:hypothetical protein B0A48_15142 [Cryoendolithus antarcticus]|uniref:Uncharacterized protein n=1 Tax=Cryoendolithus antarcticus TaxID=1507870 RepID=A0A1V8SJN5_9PEZI|nr:hypothetical protein B0A48_15142 [Cryoendolithus antarcticus]